MKQIKVSEKVKLELDYLKQENETYSQVIQRLILSNQELQQDKDKLYVILNNLSRK